MGMMDAVNWTTPPSPLREWDNAAVAIIVVAVPPRDKWQRQRWQHNRTLSPAAVVVNAALEEEHDGQQRMMEMMDVREGEGPIIVVPVITPRQLNSCWRGGCRRSTLQDGGSILHRIM